MIYLFLLVYFYSNRYNFQVSLFKSLYLLVPQVLLVYLNTEFLMPRYYFKKQYLVYFLWVLAAFALLFLYFRFTLHFTVFHNDEFPGFRNFGFLENNRHEQFTHRLKKIANFNLLESAAIFLLGMSLKTSQIALENEKRAL